MPKPVPVLAAATIAAVGLYAPAIGMFGTLDACLPTTGVASAAPSPTCASDLRECLRQSADLRQTTFGGRYVTAEDVARCMEGFNSCIHGGASGGNPPGPPTSTAGGTRGKGLPQHFGITYDGVVAIDCRLNADTVSCTDTPGPLPETMDSRTGEVTGTLSGLTMTGTRRIRTQAHYTAVPGCIEIGEGSGPVTYVFSTDGTVTMREGPMSWQTTRSGDCSGGDSHTNPSTEGTARWSAIE